MGGGPVGLGLAVELGQRDIDTVVVERSTELHHIPKGQNLTQRTMEHFRAWGVEPAMRAARIMPAGYPAVGVNAYGNLLSEYAHPWFRRSDVDEYYFARNERLPQYVTERVLRERVAELDSVSILYGTKAESIRQDGGAAYVTTKDATIKAEYVVGCDGSRSLVRQQADIGETRSDHDRRMVLVVFRSAELQKILAERFGQAAFFNVLDPELDGYWRFLGTVDAAEQWFFHVPVDPDATPATLDYQALLHDTVGTKFHSELEYMGFWDLRIAYADTYRKDRILIAGDAAHSHPPYGGYGINTGFEDARNLGWKLAAALDGWGSDGLLDTYTGERRPVFASTAHDFIENFIERDSAFVRAHNPDTDEQDFAAAWEQRRLGTGRSVDEFAPHYEGSTLVFGPNGAVSSAVGVHAKTAAPGRHLPPRQLSSGEDLFTALGSGFALITSHDATAAAFRDAAESLKVPLTIVAAEFAEGLDEYTSAHVLVRPDHYVAWVGTDEPFAAADVLAKAIGT